jgi:hypothetical protein
VAAFPSTNMRHPHHRFVVADLAVADLAVADLAIKPGPACVPVSRLPRLPGTIRDKTGCMGTTVGVKESSGRPVATHRTASGGSRW